MILAVIEKTISLPPIAPKRDILRSKALKSLQSWVAYGLPAGTLGAIIQLGLSLMQDEATLEPAADVITELITHPSSQSFEKTLCSGLLVMLSQGTLSDRLAQAFAEQDEEFLAVILKLLCILGETFPTYIIKTVTEPTTQRLLDIFLRAITFEGYYGLDQELSYVPHSMCCHFLFSQVTNLKFMNKSKLDYYFFSRRLKYLINFIPWQSATYPLALIPYSLKQWRYHRPFRIQTRIFPKKTQTSSLIP